jgi:type II secretory pathway pseudopilin PulG
MDTQGNTKGGRRRDRGVSIVELVIALGVLAVAMLALLSIIFSSGSLQQTTREKAQAYNFIRGLLEEMRSTPTFNQIYTLYKPGGANYPNATYLKNHLNLNAPTSGQQFQIVFPQVNGVLNEAAVDAELGMPKDLDWSGSVENRDVSLSYKILPVRIIVRWSSKGKVDSQIQICTYITDNR